MKLTNYRLELAFLVPDDKKLGVNEVQVTVAEAIGAINKDTLKIMKKGAVRFSSLQDLTDYDLELQEFKRNWNARIKKRDKELRNGTSSGNGDRAGQNEQQAPETLGQPKTGVQEKTDETPQGGTPEQKERS